MQDIRSLLLSDVDSTLTQLSFDHGMTDDDYAVIGDAIKKSVSQVQEPNDVLRAAVDAFSTAAEGRLQRASEASQLFEQMLSANLLEEMAPGEKPADGTVH